MKIRLTEEVGVIEEADICVLGGSCTGVFAAVRAARLGAKVVLVEKQGHFGGLATVTCTWHGLKDAEFKRQIIGGLTQEVLERLKKRGAVETVEESESIGSIFRPGELKVTLDEMVAESGVKPRLHTLFARAVAEEGELTGVVVEDKTGRGVVKAKMFIDATGDGDLCARLGLGEYRYEAVLPPTTCAFLDRWPTEGVDIGAEVRKHGAEYGIGEGFVWGTVLPGTGVFMMSGTRVRGVDCSKAEDLTRAEMEGRRQVRGIMDMLRKHRPECEAVLMDFPASIGIRDTRHIRCKYQLTGEDVLSGRRFEDGIVNGSYRVDIHHQDQPGITFMYLDGRQSTLRPGSPVELGRWREKTETNPTSYQVPLRSLIPGMYANLLLAGRMLDADKVAFSAVRVMVNTNQMGEAAGVAAWEALSSRRPVEEVDTRRVRRLLAEGGSIIF